MTLNTFDCLATILRDNSLNELADRLLETKERDFLTICAQALIKRSTNKQETKALLSFIGAI